MNPANILRAINTLIQKNGPALGPALTQTVTNALTPIADAVADAVDLYIDPIAPLISEATAQQRFAKTRTMYVAIANESATVGCTPADYVMCLVLWNSWFRTRQIRLHMAPISATDAAAIVVEIFQPNRCEDAGFKHYAALVASPHRALFDMRNQLLGAGAPVTEVYRLMHFVHQHHVSPANLNAVSVLDMRHLSLLAPPRTAFAGYADWGPGNHGSIPLNKKNHFLKHVLDAHPLPGQDLPWQGECEVWWRHLNIQLTRQDARDGMTHSFFNTHASPLFPPGTGRDDVLPFANVTALVHAVKANGGWYSGLLNQLVNTYAAAYAQAAIDLSQNMTNIIVHKLAPNNPVLMVKGINGRFYIGGRMEGNALGISTCLVPVPGTDLVNLHVPNQVWQVSP